MEKRALGLAPGALVVAFFLGYAGCDGASPQGSTEDLAATGGCDGGAASCGCKADTDCPVVSPRCDRNAGQCVECLVGSDNCPRGTHCVAAKGGFVCTASCQNASDCSPPDAGGVPQCCTGACSDPANDPFNCGGCGHTCPLLLNAVAGCRASACAIGACNTGFADCDKSDANGCEINLVTDGKNCGRCGVVCPDYPNGADPCVAGACAPTCTAGFLDCNKNPADGCEVSAQSDAQHCGRCEIQCPVVANSTPSCSAGVCAINCSQNFRDCDKMVGDGCEINVLTDAHNCGGCGVVCNVPNAVAACENGGCTVGKCNAGYSDCDGLPANGCETNSGGDVKNCGACGHACRADHGTPVCAAGQCTIGACDAGFADCNQNLADGCEDAIGTDVMNCGGCGKACPMVQNGVAGCSNGGCRVASCNFGYANCNNDPSDGCEASLLDLRSCGACGIVCAAPSNATAGCNGGLCGIGTCDALWGDCNKNAGDGCERSLAADITNCGACNKVCSFANASALCLGGVCGINACNANFGNCDGNAANGCEVNVLNDPNNCGKCGLVCPNNARTCSNGACVGCDNATEVSFNGHCYYLDGSNGRCDVGYSLVSQSVLTNIAASFFGKTYKHTISSNCCIYNSDNVENWGMTTNCNLAGPFGNGDPSLGAKMCTNAVQRTAQQLTLCGSN